MYSQHDLDEAVAAGALSADAATSLRTFVERQRSLPGVDEEHFRLITGFNDIFVAIAAAILLFAVGWIGQSIGGSLGLTLRGGNGQGPSPLAEVRAVVSPDTLVQVLESSESRAAPSADLVRGRVALTLVELADPDEIPAQGSPLDMTHWQGRGRARAPDVVYHAESAATEVATAVADILVSLVPVVGDVFDLLWRSNAKNLALLERHQHELEPRGRAGDYAIVAAAGALVAASIAAPIMLVMWIVSLFT